MSLSAEKASPVILGENGQTKLFGIEEAPYESRMNRLIRLIGGTGMTPEQVSLSYIPIDRKVEEPEEISQIS